MIAAGYSYTNKHELDLSQTLFSSDLVCHVVGVSLHLQSLTSSVFLDPEPAAVKCVDRNFSWCCHGWYQAVFSFSSVVRGAESHRGFQALHSETSPEGVG